MDSSLHLVPGRYKLTTAPGWSLRKDGTGWEKAENKCTSTSGLPTCVCVQVCIQNKISSSHAQGCLRVCVCVCVCVLCRLHICTCVFQCVVCAIKTLTKLLFIIMTPCFFFSQLR